MRAVLALALLMVIPASAAAQDCLARTPAGFVAGARLPSGARISVEGPFEASLSGRRARITIPALGLTAQAELGDVEVQLVSTVAARNGVFLTPRSRLRAQRVAGARATVGVLATDLSVASVEIPTAALALGGAPGTERCAVATDAPPEWQEIERALASGHEQILREDLALRGRAGGRTGPVRVMRGARVVRIEESGDWSRIVVDSDGTRAVGWVVSIALEPAPTREPGGGGGGMGSGRIGVGCLRGEHGVRAATLAADAPLRDRPLGRVVSTLPAGTPLELGATRDRWIAVVAVRGVRRIPRDCDGDATGLGWLPLDAVPE